MKTSFLRFCTAIALMISCSSLFAEAPEGYYNGLDGLKDRDLKDKLHEIINTVARPSGIDNYYNSLPQNCFIHSDVKDDGTWWDMYSNKQRQVYINGAVNFTSEMNREHAFPKSWWGSDKNSAYIDLNHLYPSDASANMSKQNHPLGEIDPNASGLSDFGLSRTGRPVAGQGGGDVRVFEPGDEYKGDFARTYFYMVTCYQHLTWNEDFLYMTENDNYLCFQEWAIDLLLKWHRADQVSEKETNRNDVVYNIQKNRNPFIDHPELVEYIWGANKGKAYGENGAVEEITLPQFTVSRTAGGISFNCSTTQTNVHIHDISGRTIKTVGTVENGATAALPAGVYIITSEQAQKPVKIIVND